ncbi:unnamed protein product [Brassica oleracea]
MPIYTRSCSSRPPPLPLETDLKTTTSSSPSSSKIVKRKKPDMCSLPKLQPF